MCCRDSNCSRSSRWSRCPGQDHLQLSSLPNIAYHEERLYLFEADSMLMKSEYMYFVAAVQVGGQVVFKRLELGLDESIRGSDAFCRQRLRP